MASSPDNSNDSPSSDEGEDDGSTSVEGRDTYTRG